ncbi:putative TFIIIC transcription initiation factor complex subunits Tfc3 [Aspergillus undulatus]|uniref:putative TFIIIC transcription initiation factor complex subunits Tfc3 n=1 Tax=Aspergillus undulatus TaxID=1810928 RepID=UPI003CCD51BD
MAPSLRDLIDFLLAEIALCGSQGASPADILSFIYSFYARSATDGSGRTPVIDRQFQEKVWQWLTRNPEVSVGKEREGNGLTLEETERRPQGLKEGQRTSGPINVFVSEERTWLAITGHEPDDTKVLPMEFQLLSIIASRKSSGIAQPELIKLSGQDKRSVPKRTDMLQKKGYIEKRAIQLKAVRTSLVTLRKFLTPEALAAEATATGPSGAAQNAATMIDFKQFTGRLFEVMREHKIISRNDLKATLEFNDRWHWKVLSRTLRKWERIGCVKRVRALSQYATTMKKYHPCIMLVREPTEKDMKTFLEFSRHMYFDMDQGENAEFEDDADAEESGEPSATGDIQAMGKEEDVQASGRVLPIWSPDRCIHNQIFEVVDRTGTSGSTNSDVLKACVGVFWRRPLENTLARLSECWQLSQPPHLRHLALVRDTALHRTITHYVQYSARNFGKLVEAGEALWEAVEFAPRNPKLDNVRVPPVDAKPQLDIYGLPFDAPATELLKNGDCSLSECMWVVKPKDYTISSSDPKAVKLEDGGYSESYQLRAFSLAGSRSTPETPVRLKFEDEAMPSVGLDSAATPAPVRKASRKPKHDPDKFAGMSQKEKFEAMGMDESWTEYSVLLIDRPNPGVYVTKRGRRRPAGKERGRPPVSRIAVFKSPKLLDLPWFEKDESGDRASAAPSPAHRNADEGISTPVAGNSTDPAGTQELGTARGTKRPTQRSSPDTEAGSSGRDSKIRRTGDASNCLEEPGAEAARVPSTPQSRGKRKRALSPETGHQAAVPARKKGGRAARVEQNPQSTSNEETPSVSQGATEPSTDSNTMPETPQVENRVAPGTGPSTANGISHAANSTATPVQLSTPGPQQNGTPMSQISPTPGSSPAKAVRTKLLDKGGSVALLRRKIVMDIVEKAGGAYPMGSTLWYPFVTAWTKTKYKEKPDMRTLRAAVKHLVDAGRLRQQTFCGKDSKGVMVTKTIICKADLAPDDPIVKKMQEKILASDPRHYFPPGVEVDPSISKQSTTPKAFKGLLPPVESRLTVQLHQKPAAVAAMEKRRGNAAQRQMLRQIEVGKMRERMQEIRPSGAIRLLKIPRSDRNASAVPLAPQLPGEEPLWGILNQQGGKVARPVTGGIRARQVKRSRLPLSLMAPYAMLMSPTQTFNPANGTFSTNAGLSTLKRRRPGRSRLTPEMLMLMTPLQVFNPATGTFSTHAGLAGYIVVRDTQYRMSHKPEAHLPHSLDDLFTQAGRRKRLDAGGTDPRSMNFIRDTNAILRWELQNERLLQQEKSQDLHYINQGINDSFESAPIEGGIRFKDTNVTSDPTVRTRRRSRQERELLPRDSTDFIFEEHPPFEERPPSPEPINTLDMRYFAPAPTYVRPVAPRPSAPQPPRQRRVEKLAAANDSTFASPGKVPVRRRIPFHLSRSTYQNLMTAVVAVRALAGGLDGRNVDWNLISCCFPDQDAKTVQDKGKGILARNRLQIAKMQSDFQERFIEAYANDEVPPIDYNDLEGYDWGAVIEWANARLDVPKSYKTPDLPATREQFDDIFEIREEPTNSLDELYQTQGVTLTRKRALIASVPFATPLSLSSSNHPSQHQHHPPLSPFDTVKTWVRANVTTPNEVYNASDARDALSRFDGGTLNNALQSLVTERVISQANKGRIVPGRNYDLTDHFIHTLGKKRPIEASELRRAVKFKVDILDAALREQGVYSVRANAEDGDILALINLFSMGLVNLVPRDAPREKFGLTDGGYLTRHMDKEKLRFPVDVVPIKKKYVDGNPIAERVTSTTPPCPPRSIPVPGSGSAALSLPEKFPLWIDIHGGVIRILWDLALAAVLGTVAVRPGISAGKLAGMIRPTMAGWEVNMVCEWLRDVGVMVRRGGGQEGDGDGGEQGWFVREWWWMVLA